MVQKRTTSALVRTVKIDQAVQVWSLMQQFPKMSQAKACAQVGIDPSTYRKWIAEAEDALRLFRQALLQSKRQQLTKVIIAQEHILDKVIQDGLSSYTDPAVRLMILQYLSERGDQLVGDVHAKTGNAADFLSGPRLEKAENRFSSGEADITITISPKRDIIDVTPRDDEE